MLDIFLISLIPNFLRQIVYLKASKKGFGFCVSPETRYMKKRGLLPWVGFLEELGWAGLWTLFWALGWKWLMFGWVSDALLDCIVAMAWAKGAKKPSFLFYGGKGAFSIREIILPYLLLGPFVWWIGFGFVAYALSVSVVGIILWIII